MDLKNLSAYFHMLPFEHEGFMYMAFITDEKIEKIVLLGTGQEMAQTEALVSSLADAYDGLDFENVVN